MRQPQAKLGCWCTATCSRRLTKAQTRALLMSACIALNSRLRNMAALFVCATSPDASTAYSALQHNRPSIRLKVQAMLAAARDSHGCTGWVPVSPHASARHTHILMLQGLHMRRSCTLIGV